MNNDNEHSAEIAEATSKKQSADIAEATSVRKSADTAEAAIMATVRIKIPTFNSDTDEYDTYMHEVDMWKIIGKIDKKEQAMMLVYELNKDDSSGIRDKIMNELSLDELNKDDGLDKYVKYMDDHFKKDDSVATYEAYLNFEQCKKKDDEEIKTYILRYDKQSNIARKKKVTYPKLVLALKLLDNCRLSDVDRKLVLSEMDFSKEDVYDKTKSALVKYKSNTVCSKSALNIKPESEIKIEESVMITRQPPSLEEALVAAGWQKPRSNSNPERGRGRGRGRYQGNQNFSGRNNRDFSGDRYSGKNPMWQGERKRCFICDSTNHMKDQCPHDRASNMNNNRNNRYDNTRKLDSAYFADEISMSDQAASLARGDEEYYAYCAVESVVLYTGDNKDEMLTFCLESINCAILDSACTSNVCGTEWLETLLSVFTPEEYDLIVIEKGVKRFKCGGDEILQSTMSPMVEHELWVYGQI